MGLWAFSYLVLHSLMFLSSVYNWSFGELFNFASPYGLPFTAAIISLVLFLAMAVTSNRYSVQKLGVKKWKFLQRLGYIALLFVLAHIYFLPGQDFISTPHGQFITLLLLVVFFLKVFSMIAGYEKYHTNY